MKYIDDLLEKIDTYYKNGTQKDKIYSYIMAGGGIAVLIYLTTYDLTANMYKQADKHRSEILSKLKVDKQYLKQYRIDDINALQMQNSNLKKQFVKIKKTSDYIDYKISQLSPLIYNEAAWGSFLDSISDIAKHNHIHINKLLNKYTDSKSDFGHVLDIELAFDGNFQNTLQFINALEKTPLVVDIHNMEITADERLNTTLKIAVWGISY